MRISDWSSDVCSSDLVAVGAHRRLVVVVGHDEDDVRPPRTRIAHHRWRAAAEPGRQRKPDARGAQAFECVKTVTRSGHCVPVPETRLFLIVIPAAEGTQRLWHGKCGATGIPLPRGGTSGG